MSTNDQGNGQCHYKIQSIIHGLQEHQEFFFARNAHHSMPVHFNHSISNHDPRASKLSKSPEITPDLGCTNP